VQLQEAGRDREEHSEQVQVPEASGNTAPAVGDMPSVDEVVVEKTNNRLRSMLRSVRMVHWLWSHVLHPSSQ
jgi:hypothetical protein